MALIFESETPKLKDFYVRDPAPETRQWQGRDALHLSGQGASLLLIPDFDLANGKIKVDIGSEGVAYPGIVFRANDTNNYELAYAQPHTSGKWDAIQYDPVFHGSNTWQLYHGPCNQQVAEVPAMNWFTFKVEFRNRQALIQVGEQTPLLINPLAHSFQTGLVGLWTYLPAYFSNLQIWDDVPDFSPQVFCSPQKNLAKGIITEWFMEGFGKVICEPSGILNLNRYLPVTTPQIRLVRWIQMPEDGNFNLNFGFSDELTLQIDEQILFTGQNIYHNSPDWSEKGYVYLNNQINCLVPQGLHKLVATLKATEFFGFGLIFKIEGNIYTLQPSRLCE